MEWSWWCHSLSSVFMGTTHTKSIAIHVMSVMMFAQYARSMKHLTKKMSYRRKASERIWVFTKVWVENKETKKKIRKAVHHIPPILGRQQRPKFKKEFSGKGLGTINNCYMASEHLQGYLLLPQFLCRPSLCWSRVNITLFRNLP